MSLNLTAAFLEARKSTVLLCFSGNVTTSTVFLAGAGGIAAEGFALPRGGRLARLDVYDGSTIHSIDVDIAVSAGDLLSVVATWIGGSSTFSVSVQISNSITMATVQSLPPNNAYLATVTLLLKET